MKPGYAAAAVVLGIPLALGSSAGAVVHGDMPPIGGAATTSLDAESSDGGRQAMERAFAARGIDTSTFGAEAKSAITAGVAVLATVNDGSVTTIEDVIAATAGDVRFRFEGVDDLKSLGGDRLHGVATLDGRVLLDAALEDDPVLLRAVASIEIGERIFQEVATAQASIGLPLPTANPDGTSRGDFGNEFHGQLSGFPGSVVLSSFENDTVLTADGSVGEACNPEVNRLQRFVNFLRGEWERTRANFRLWRERFWHRNNIFDQDIFHPSIQEAQRHMDFWEGAQQRVRVELVRNEDELRRQRPSCFNFNAP